MRLIPNLKTRETQAFVVIAATEYSVHAHGFGGVDECRHGMGRVCFGSPQVGLSNSPEKHPRRKERREMDR